MAMNKSERLEFETLLKERDMARALRWPEYQKPLRLTVHPGSSVRGWFQNSYSKSVTLGHSNGVVHNPVGGTGTNTQGHGVMYRLQSEALQAMRIELTERYAKELADVDARIEAAQRSES